MAATMIEHGEDTIVWQLRHALVAAQPAEALVGSRNAERWAIHSENPIYNISRPAVI